MKTANIDLECMMRVSMTLQTDFDQFDDQKWDFVVQKLSDIAGCNPQDFFLIEKKRGCTILRFALPRNAGEKLLKAFEEFMKNPEDSEKFSALTDLAEELHLTQMYEMPNTSIEIIMKKIEKEKPEGKALIFVHGWAGDESSFGDLPKYLESQCKCKRMIYSYPTGVWKHSPSIVLIGDAFRNWIANNAPKLEVAIICHSMGGLVVRQSILAEAFGSDRRLDLNIRNIVFIASPHNGSAYASIAKSIPPLKSAQIQELSPNSPTLYQIASRWNKWVKDYVPEFCRIDSIFGSKDKVVSAVNAVGTSEEVVPILGHDHTSICKPNGKDDEIVTTIMRFLRSTSFMANPAEFV